MAEFEEMYEQAPGEQVEETVTEDPPAGYKPLSTKQRTDWNNFLRYINREKKIGGSKELDDRSNARGLALLDEYKQNNPDFSVTRDLVPYIQYEFQQLKNTGNLPNTNPTGDVKQLVSTYYNDRQVSPVDGWIGSLTSRQAYPEVTAFSYDPEKRYWGLDYDAASKWEAENKKRSR